MGRQWNTIIESLGPLTGGTMSINANLTEIEALLTTLQADVADGIVVTGGSTVVTGGTLGQITSGTVTANVLARAVNNGSEPQFGPIPLIGYDEGIDGADRGFVIPVQLTNANGSILNDVPISGTVTANPIYATSGGTGPTTFTSTSYGTIAASNSGRKGLTVFNEGAGNLHITIGTATTSTSSYTIRISAGDYYELPYNYTGLIGGIFATAGTARVTEIV
jgi:hypothetical protein